MNVLSAVRPQDVDRYPDEELIERIRGGETALYEILMRRYNRRVYRAVLAILRNDSEAEDAMQEAYVRAYQHLGEFAGEERDPERQAYDGELRAVLERAIDGLPDHYRSVFMLRVVEEMDVNETAAVLDISEENVKTRLHRGRALLRKELERRAGIVASQAFPFHLSRCDRVVEGVMRRIGGG